VLHGPTIQVMREARIRRALDAGRAEQALIEAEELLDADPDNALGLYLAGEAALDVGDAATAALAYARALEKDPARADAHIGLAVAHFDQSDLAGAEEAARGALARDALLAEAWYWLGLALERSGRTDEGAAALEKAHEIEPATYPRPRAPPTEAVWMRALDRARRSLPGPLRAFYARVPLAWADFPSPDELRATDPPLSPFAPALYEGTPPATGDPWTELPKRVRLFRHNLDRPPASDDELVERIAAALAQEAWDWVGEEPAGS
jgi:tetratricopeptide (TPR) repeat protein